MVSVRLLRRADLNYVTGTLMTRVQEQAALTFARQTVQFPSVRLTLTPADTGIIVIPVTAEHLKGYYHTTVTHAAVRLIVDGVEVAGEVKLEHGGCSVMVNASGDPIEFFHSPVTRTLALVTGGTPARLHANPDARLTSDQGAAELAALATWRVQLNPVDALHEYPECQVELTLAGHAATCGIRAHDVLAVPGGAEAGAGAGAGAGAHV